MLSANRVPIETLVGFGLVNERGQKANRLSTHERGEPVTTAWCYFLLRRWTRVFFSSLRCFFFAIRLRRFLMTEPITRPR